jgi:hypothetical protein
LKGERNHLGPAVETSIKQTNKPTKTNMNHKEINNTSSVIITFTGVHLPWGFLGNMAPYPISYQGQVWRTSEALFQALRFDDPEIRSLIRAEKSPMAAKMKAKSFRDRMVVLPMSDADVQNMREVLGLKFDAHPEIRKKLIASGNHLLVEDVEKRNGERHLFWGMKKVNGEWIGNNMLGKLLMELRQAYSGNP